MTRNKTKATMTKVEQDRQELTVAQCRPLLLASV
jgi:hypothetical protein